MQELTSLMENVARLLAVLGGGISAIAFCYAGILWMTASGDPQKMGQARTAIFGAVGGLVIVGIAFMAPRIISEFVIEPAGGQVLGGDYGVSCDDILRAQLLVQRGASTADRMNQVISQIQAQRDECPEDVWNPVVVDDPFVVASSPAGATATDCWGLGIVRALPSHGFPNTKGILGRIGDTQVPRSLRVGNTDGVGTPDGSSDGHVRERSGRDSSNNILVYWSGNPDQRPTDSSTCWLYVQRIRTWDENY